MKGIVLKNGLWIFLLLISFSCLSESEKKEKGVPVKIDMQELSDGDQIFYSFTLPDILADSAESVYWTVDKNDPVKSKTLIIAFSDSQKHTITAQVEPKPDGYLIEKNVFHSKPVEFPSEKKYLTIENPEGLFVLPGDVTSFKGLESQSSSLIRVSPFTSPGVYQMTTTGFHLISLINGSATVDYNVFISPVPSFHLERTDRDWYYTQWHTNTTSNCGPTIVSMGLAWADNLDVSVPQVREIVGWRGAGGVNFHEMKTVFDKYGVTSQIVSLKGVQDFFDIIDQGHILGIVYDMAGLQKVENPSVNLLGQYYNDHGGHFLALKGYSLDKKYVIIQDPIPSDWKYNRERYADGESMWGRNRYYPAQELFNALLLTDAIEIFPVH